MPFNLGGPELIIILVIVLIVFGAGKLPNVMKDVGRGVKEFKRAQTTDEDVENAMPTSTSVPASTTSTTTPVTSASAAPTNGAASAAPNGTAASARPTETSSRA